MTIYVTPGHEDPMLIVTDDDGGNALDGGDPDIEVIEGPGPRGAPGPPGPPGPPGNIDQMGFAHENGPSDTWVVPHNFGYNPAGIVILDSAGSIVEPQSVVYDSLTQLTLTFLHPFGGTVFLS